MIAPIIEELFFRGGLLDYLDRLPFFRRKELISNILVSFVFCFFHIFVSDFLHASLVFFPSLFLGFVYQKTRCWMICALFHAFFNMFYIFLSYMGLDML